MAIIQSKAFAGNIKWLKTRGEEFEARLRDSMAFIAYCGLKDGNATPAKQWRDAGLPKWLAAMGDAAEQRKDKKLKPEQCAEKAEEIAAALVARTLAAEQRKRDAAKAKRDAAKAKPATPKDAPSVGLGAQSTQPAPPKTSTTAHKPDAPAPRKTEAVEHYTLGHYNTGLGADEVLHLTADEYEIAVKAVQQARAAAAKLKTA